MDWNKYINYITAEGKTQRDRNVTRLKNQINNKVSSNPSYKSVKLNGEETNLIINTSTKPYYKEFQSLPDQKILAGDYVEWANSMWIVLNADCDDEVYIDGNLRQCQYCIYWQKTDGTIVSRFVYIEDASTYSNGETGNNTITLQSNQFMVYLPYDEETAELDNGKRVHMSRSNRKCKPYELTKPDDITYSFGEKGILNVIFTQDQFNSNEDKLVTLDNGNEIWICNYKDISTPTTPQPETFDNITDLNAIITSNGNLKVGFFRTYTVNFTGKNGSIDWNTVNFIWNVVSNFEVEQIVTDNKIKLRVNDNSCIGENFVLQCIINDTVVVEKEITVRELI